MIIETHGLTRRFRSLEALHDIDLGVEAGSAVALVGPNGAGKTTLLKLLVNLLQPSAGSATVLGTDSRRIGATELARIGYVSEGQQLPRRLTVAQWFDWLRPLYANWDRELERDLRARFGLPADRRIGALSHGQRIKTALAAALPFHPAVLVLDEPLSGLDPLARDEFMEGVLGQAGETTVLISSHELAEIEHGVTHVAYLDEGRLLLHESSEGLAARVREVRVLVTGEARVPERLPRDWIDARAAGSVLSFVHTAFREATLGDEVRATVGGVQRIDTEALPLRATFVAMARHARHSGQHGRGGRA